MLLHGLIDVPLSLLCFFPPCFAFVVLTLVFLPGLYSAAIMTAFLAEEDVVFFAVHAHCVIVFRLFLLLLPLFVIFVSGLLLFCCFLSFCDLPGDDAVCGLFSFLFHSLFFPCFVSPTVFTVGLCLVPSTV